MTNRIIENATEFAPDLTIEALTARIKNVAQRGASPALGTRAAKGPADSELVDTAGLAELQGEFNQAIVSAMRSIAEHLKQSRTPNKPSTMDVTPPIEALAAQVSALAERLDHSVAAWNAADESHRALLDALRQRVDALEHRAADFCQLQQQFACNQTALQQLQQEFAAGRQRAEARQAEMELRLLRAERSLRKSARLITSSRPSETRPAPGETLETASGTPISARPGESVLSAASDAPELPFDYFLFEHRFRGSTEEIKRRHEAYLDYFLTAECVLDLGCGRGEFLELLTERGISAIGVDLNSDMVDFCRFHGLPVRRGDVFELLGAQADGSIGGIFVSQVVEHLPPDQVWKLIQLAAIKLKPDGVLLLETLNPQCFPAISCFYLDPSHVRPYHAGLLAFMCEQAGLWLECLQFSAPLPGATGGAILKSPENIPPWEAAEYQDYAVIARRSSRFLESQ